MLGWLREKQSRWSRAAMPRVRTFAGRPALQAATRCRQRLAACGRAARLHQPDPPGRGERSAHVTAAVCIVMAQQRARDGAH